MIMNSLIIEFEQLMSMSDDDEKIITILGGRELRIKIRDTKKGQFKWFLTSYRECS